MISLLTIALSLAPILIFLLVLILVDSYKLAPLRVIVLCLVFGMASAALALGLNGLLIDLISIPKPQYARYVAPVVEELLKALPLFYLIISRRVGFLIDSAIYGVAVGAGFSLFENLYFFVLTDNYSLALALIRGFGTAVMHGGTTAIFAIIVKNGIDQHRHSTQLVLSLALIVAAAIHSAFNHFLLPPAGTMLVIVVSIPAMIYAVFERSKQSIKDWLGVGMDREMELLDSITTGELVNSRVGQYLQSLKQHVSPENLVDMLCMLRIQTELSLGVKAMMLMRQAGLSLPLDESVKAQFAELKHLEQSIGPTGKIALQPLLRTDSRELWQLYSLNR